MIFKLFIGGSITIYFGSRIITKVLRKLHGWEDTNSQEYKEKKIREFLEKSKDVKVIENSKGENWF
jgi:hypothetical protein